MATLARPETRPSPHETELFRRFEASFLGEDLSDMANAILRLPTVKARTGLSRSTIYLRISQGSFPKQVSLGARAVGWLENEIDEWIARQIEQSHKAVK